MRILFVLVFLLHELEEILFLPQWLDVHRESLEAFMPEKLRGILSLNRIPLCFMVAEEFILVTLFAFTFDNLWWSAVIMAFALHLVAHLLQSMALKKPLPMIRSSVVALLLCVFLLWDQRPLWLRLCFPTVVMTTLMVLNLLAMHSMAQWSRQRQSGRK